MEGCELGAEAVQYAGIEYGTAREASHDLPINVRPNQLQQRLGKGLPELRHQRNSVCHLRTAASSPQAIQALRTALPTLTAF